MKRRDMIRYTITAGLLFTSAGTACEDQILVPLILTAAAVVVFLAKKKAPAHARESDADFNNISRLNYSTERRIIQ